MNAASQVLFALTAAMWGPAVNTYLTCQINGAERAEVFGQLNAFRGMIAFPAPTLCGLLHAWGGMRAPLIANLIDIFVMIAASFSSCTKRREK